MRNLERNLQTVFYRMYCGTVERVDEEGNPTGSYVPAYSELRSVRLCVSPHVGKAEIYQFGQLAEYDRTMTTADTSCEIDESTVLWLDGADPDGPWNYIVKAKAVWMNSVQYAIRAVTVADHSPETGPVYGLDYGR